MIRVIEKSKVVSNSGNKLSSFSDLRPKTYGKIIHYKTQEKHVKGIGYVTFDIQTKTNEQKRRSQGDLSPLCLWFFCLILE